MHPTQQAILSLADTQDLSQLTLREIGQYVGIEHPQKIKHHLRQLEKKGMINLMHSGYSSLKRSSNTDIKFFNIPLLGEVNCGPAKLFTDNPTRDFLKVSSSIVRKKEGLFALKAIGNSMNKANINNNNIEEGDYVIVDSKITKPDNGEYVVSIIDNAANVKRFYDDKRNKQIVLISESAENLSPIYIAYDDFDYYLVAGKVIKVIKKPEFL